MLKDLKSTVKNSAIYGIGNLSTKLVGFILLPFYATQFSVSEYGIISLMEVTSQIFVSIFALGLNQALFRFYFDEKWKEKQKSLFFTSWFFLLVFVSLMWLLISFFSAPISKVLFESANFSYILKLMFVSAALEIVYMMPSTLMRLQERSVLFTTANIVRLSVSMSFTLLFMLVFKRGIQSIYEAALLAQIAYAIFLSKYIRKNSIFHFEKEALKEMLAFSYPFVFAAISAVILSIADRYSIKFVGGGLHDVGLYSLGLKMANVVSVFIVASVNLAWAPLIFKKMNDPNCKRFYSKIMTYYVFGLMFFVMGVAFFGKEIIKIAAPNPDYWNSYIYIPVLCLSIVFGVMKDTSLTGLMITKKTGNIASIITLVSGVNIGLNFVFIHFFDAMGAAIATLVSNIFYFFLVYRFAQKHYPIPYELRKVFLLILVGVSLYFAASLTNELNLFFRLTIKSLLILTFPFILYFLRFYEAVELEAIRNGWQKWKNPKNWKNNLQNIRI